MTIKLTKDEFVHVMKFLLEMISAQDYIRLQGIYCSSPISDWKKFKNQITTQKIKPGIYPRSFGRNGVHYYAVREENSGQKTVANGYKTVAGLDKKHAVGLDAQTDHGHGLCQTFALMYVNKDDYKLNVSPLNMFTNSSDRHYGCALIGLYYLKTVIIEKQDWCWDLDSKECKDIKFLSNYNKDIKKSREICLSDLINIVLDKKFRKYLPYWFSDGVQEDINKRVNEKTLGII